VKDNPEGKGARPGHASGPWYFPCFSSLSFFFVLLYFKAEYGVLTETVYLNKFPGVFRFVL
jgi:hypothetical protein